MLFNTNAKLGALSGLVSGVLLGVLLQVFAIKTPAGSRVILMEVINPMSGSNSLLLGWFFYLFDSILMGAIFGFLLGTKALNFKSGLKYAFLCSLGWWILGGIFFMPIFLGLSIFSPQSLEPIQPVALQSLIGHILFGLIFGGVFVALKAKTRKPEMREIHREADRSRFKAS